MGNKPQQQQDIFLDLLRQGRTPVAMFLVNGIKLSGQIESFDQYSVVLKSAVSQMVFKHAISTIVPASGVDRLRETSDVSRVSDHHANDNFPDVQQKPAPVITRRPKSRLVTTEN